jgi:hypothetical protein
MDAQQERRSERACDLVMMWHLRPWSYCVTMWIFSTLGRLAHHLAGSAHTKQADSPHLSHGEVGGQASRDAAALTVLP